jgi:hypothetical protein
MDEAAAKAERLRAALGIPEYDKEAYRITNDAMKPILGHYGYRSLAQFERACEEHDGNPPWPKVS